MDQEVAFRRSLQASTAETIIITDAWGYIVEMNPAGEKLTGWMTSDMAEKLIFQHALNWALSTKPTQTKATQGCSHWQLQPVGRKSNPNQ